MALRCIHRHNRVIEHDCTTIFDLESGAIVSFFRESLVEGLKGLFLAGEE